MFYVEEDIAPAVDMAQNLFGTVGNMSNESNTMKNISVATREFGKLWYGDIDGKFSTTMIVEKLGSLSKSLQQKVYILDDSFDFDKPVLSINF